MHLVYVVGLGDLGGPADRDAHARRECDDQTADRDRAHARARALDGLHE